MKEPGKIKLTKEDKETFAREAKTLNPLEFLALSRFINDYKDGFTKADMKFFNSQLGRRAERLLRNVVENFSFDDRPERKMEKRQNFKRQGGRGTPRKPKRQKGKHPSENGGMKVRGHSKEEMIMAFRAILRSVERQGMTDLLAWLETTDFYTAPASTKYHGAHECGLLEHSLAVYENLLKRAVGHDLDSIAIVGLLHDVCKADFYTKCTKNQKDADGEWQQVECWGYDNQFPAGHGEKSVMLIMRYIQLTDEEIMAINWHMGGFDARARTDGHSLFDAWAKYPLAVMVHLADMEDTWLAGKGGKAE